MKKTAISLVGLMAFIIIVTHGFAAYGQTLQEKAASMESRVKTLEQRVWQLQQLVNKLQSVVQISQGNVQIVSSSILTLMGAQIDVSASALLNLKGAVLTLNGSGRPLARVGDQVYVTVPIPQNAGTSTGTGQIVQGSSRVLAGD